MDNTLKIAISVFVGIAIIIFASMGYIYWNYFRGAWPAIEKPPQDITKTINSTDFPLVLSSNFSISIFAKDLKGPRVIKYDPDGNMLTSITSEGKVVALPDKDANGVADKTMIVAEGLNNPHGLAFQCEDSTSGQKCRLYIAESDQIAAYDYDRETLKISNKKKIADLSGNGQHFTRTIDFGPDGRLYVSIGSDCNVCIESDIKRAKIFSMNPDGSDLKEYAKGLRNAVFFTWHPVTGKMWATEMGRDFLGDELPPDEINIIEEGKNYGWPICYGKNIHDTDFDKNTYIRNPCMEPFETPSYIDIPAHSAPLGLAFVPEDIQKGSTGAGIAWPEEYWHDLLVAYHGSWNRTAPTGYKIVRYKLDRDGNFSGTDTSSGAPQAENFITVWLKPGDGAYGRPVDLIVLPGGITYISDDKAGVIYRVTYNK